MKIVMQPIGFVRTSAEQLPRHWTVSDVEGSLVIDERYLQGLRDIKAGQRIVVIFYFHRSPQFSEKYLVQKPPHLKKRMGVFSICSPIRPNPVGMSVVGVVDVEGNIIQVKGLDMFDGTPILDIKPYAEDE